jgi:hypothetical protein
MMASGRDSVKKKSRQFGSDMIDAEIFQRVKSVKRCKRLKREENAYMTTGTTVSVWSDGAM